MKFIIFFLLFFGKCIFSKWIGNFKSFSEEKTFKINKGIYYEIILTLSGENKKELRSTATLTLNDHDNYILMKEPEINIDTFKSLEYKFHIGIKCSNDIKLNKNYTVPLILSESNITLNPLNVSFYNEKNNIELIYKSTLYNNSFEIISMNKSFMNVDNLDLIFQNINKDDKFSYIRPYDFPNTYIYYNWNYNKTLKKHSYNIIFKDNSLENCFNLKNSTFNYIDIDENVKDIRELKSKIKRENNIIKVERTDLDLFYILCSAKSYKSSERKTFYEYCRNNTPFNLSFTNFLKDEEYAISCYVDNMGNGKSFSSFIIDLGEYKINSTYLKYLQCFSIEFEEWTNIQKFTELSVNLCDNMIKNDLFEGNYDYEKNGCLSCENIHRYEFLDYNNKVVEICTYINPLCNSSFSKTDEIEEMFDNFYNKVNTTENILKYLQLENMRIKSARKINPKINYDINETLIFFKLNKINSKNIEIQTENKGNFDIKCYFGITNNDITSIFDLFDLSKDNEKLIYNKTKLNISLNFDFQEYDNQMYKLNALCFDKWNEKIRGGPFYISTFLHTNKTINLPEKDKSEDKYKNIHSIRHTLQIINDEKIQLFQQLNLTDKEAYLLSEMEKSEIDIKNIARFLSLVNCSNYPSYDKCFDLKSNKFSKLMDFLNLSNINVEMGFEITNNPDVIKEEYFEKIIFVLNSTEKYIDYNNILFSLGIFGNLFDIIKFGVAKNFTYISIREDYDFILKNEKMDYINNIFEKVLTNYLKYKNDLDDDFNHDNYYISIIKKNNVNENYIFESNDVKYELSFNKDNLFKETQAENIIILFFKNESYPNFKYDTNKISLNVLRILLFDKDYNIIKYEKELKEKLVLNIKTSNKDYVKCYSYNYISNKLEFKKYDIIDNKFCNIKKLGDITIGVDIKKNNLITLIIFLVLIILSFFIVLLIIISFNRKTDSNSINYQAVNPLDENII